MKIDNYQINLRKTFKIVSVYTDLYNERQPNTSLKIKNTADKLIMYLLKQCNSQLKRDYEKFDTISIDTNESFILYTNTTRIAKHLRISKNTVRNNLRRLIKSGIIKNKTLHGRYKDYELHINPDFLYIFSDDNPKIRNFSKDFELAVNESFTKNKTQILSQYILLQERLNNILINVSGVDNEINKQANSEITQQNNNFVINKLKTQELPDRKQEININNKYSKNTKHISGILKNVLQERTAANSGKPENPLKKSTSQTLSSKCPGTQKEKSSAKKEKTKYPTANQIQKNINRYKMQIAKWIVSYAIALLWKDKSVFAAEYEKTVLYVYNMYFQNADTYDKIDDRKAEIKWRLEAAQRYIRRKNFTISIFPYRYFDFNNKTSGFVTTRKWYLQNLQYHIKKKKIKQQKTNEQKLNAAIRLYAKSPTLSEFKRQEHYVKSNIPHLLESFYQHFTNS